jgi:hypothetical protein
MIEELKKQVRSIEERWITNDNKSLMTDPAQLTMEPRNPEAEPEKSYNLQGTVYREPDSSDISTKDEFGLDQEDIPKSIDSDEPETSEQKEVSAREELNLCLDLALEAIKRASEVSDESEDLSLFDEAMMRRIEELSTKAVEFADKVEEKVYDYEDEPEVEEEPEEPDEDQEVPQEGTGEEGPDEP